jgi:hypothetical protein
VRLAAVNEGNDLVIACVFILEAGSFKVSKVFGGFDELGKAVS